MTLFIHAPNIHLGGGRTLLLALLSALKQPAVVQLDTRLDPLPELASGVEVIRVAPTILSRLKAERRLQRLCRNDDILLCFGNLPPLFNCSAQVYVYLQNRYLTSLRPLNGLPWSVRMRIRVERLWLRHRLRSSTPLVQTETMMHEVQKFFGREAIVLPFFPVARRTLPARQTVAYDYLYVASGEPHKNHNRLIEAWTILAQYGHRPSLCLTLDPQRDADLCSWVEQMTRQFGLCVSNNPLPPDHISGLYEQCGVLIYPSLFESFGLPLLEARQAGLPIIAAERDYVRDVVAPLETFDPESSLSIARALLRYHDKLHEPAMPCNAADFLNQLPELTVKMRSFQ